MTVAAGPQRSLTSPRSWRFWLAVCVPAVAFLGGEGFARLWCGLGDPPLSVSDPDVEYLFKPGTYSRFGNTVHINSHHMRSAELSPGKTDAAELRLLVLGDSVVNGGALTDQRDLATEILAADLARATRRAVVVGNASAGSWGPGNLLAYVRKFGLFDADVVVVVLNSHDVGDNPTGRPVVGVEPGFPARAPLLALEEGVQRYLMPRLLALWPGRRTAPPAPETAAERAAAAERSLADLGSLVDLIRGGPAPVVLVLSPDRGEAAGTESPGAAAIRRFAADREVRFVDLAAAFGNALSRGDDPYRPGDTIHPNELGQRLLADEIRAAVLELAAPAAERGE